MFTMIIFYNALQEIQTNTVQYLVNFPNIDLIAMCIMSQLKIQTNTTDSQTNKPIVAGNFF